MRRIYRFLGVDLGEMHLLNLRIQTLLENGRLNKIESSDELGVGNAKVLDIRSLDIFVHRLSLNVPYV